MVEGTTSKEVDALWETLKRIDFYLGTTNFKSALLITLNSAILGTILLNHQKIVTLDEASINYTFSYGLLTIAVISSLISIIFVLLSIFPKLNSGQKKTSLIFYENIGSIKSVDIFKRELKERNPEDLLDDLAGQIWVVSKIAVAKFTCLRRAVLSLMVGAIMPLFILSMIVFA